MRRRCHLLTVVVVGTAKAVAIATKRADATKRYSTLRQRLQKG